MMKRLLDRMAEDGTIKPGDRFRHKNGMVYTVTGIDGNEVNHRGPHGNGWSWGDTFFNWFTREPAEPLGASDPIQGPEPLAHDFSDPYCVVIGRDGDQKIPHRVCVACGHMPESVDCFAPSTCSPDANWRNRHEMNIRRLTGRWFSPLSALDTLEPSEPSYSGLGAAQFGAWDGYAGSSRRR